MLLLLLLLLLLLVKCPPSHVPQEGGTMHAPLRPALPWSHTLPLAVSKMVHMLLLLPAGKAVNTQPQQWMGAAVFGVCPVGDSCSL